MKWKLLLCVSLLALAGCQSENNNAYSAYGEFGFSYDLIPPPIAGLSAADLQQIYGASGGLAPVIYGQNGSTGVAH
jgi:hypothetical protein